MSDRRTTVGGRLVEPGRHRPPVAFRPEPAMMVWACRKLARDLRREAAAGWGPVPLADGGSISRAEAAASMDLRGDMWAAKVGAKHER